jgi:tRNA threonylcarbamoyladenosine biosynthesis protein TsaE
MDSLIKKTFVSTSSEETVEVGRQISKLLSKKELICLTGDLGAGKTTLVKGIVHELTGTLPDEVVSPTFTYLNIYQGKTSLYHFDLYRLSSEEEFLSAGFDEFLEKEGICCVEWPDRLPKKTLPEKISIHIEYLTEKKRKITVSRSYESQLC